METIDEILAADVIVGDPIMVGDDQIEVREVEDDEDIDFVNIKGWSHNSGDYVHYRLRYDELVEIWGA